MRRICPVCNGDGPVARAIGVCVACVRAGREEAVRLSTEARQGARRRYDLPGVPPRDAEDSCDRCFRNCAPAPGARGYCGVRTRAPDGALTGGDSEAPAHWYYDPLPTNCVADWLCAAGSSSDIPERRRNGKQPVNLAVFAYGCTFDCLYCQNESCRNVVTTPERATPVEMAAAVDERTACVCFFGGDVTPQLPLALEAVRRAREHRSFHVCFETNGAGSPALLEQMIDVALQTGGTIKFDLKAWDPALHSVLTDAPRGKVWTNLERLIERGKARASGPPLAAISTCLVPGYVDAEEVSHIAGQVAALDPDTPYSLLAFQPAHLLNDLPATSLAQARACEAAAQDAGLTRVRVGNLHLLH